MAERIQLYVLDTALVPRQARRKPAATLLVSGRIRSSRQHALQVLAAIMLLLLGAKGPDERLGQRAIVPRAARRLIGLRFILHLLIDEDRLGEGASLLIGLEQRHSTSTFTPVSFIIDNVQKIAARELARELGVPLGVGRVEVPEHQLVIVGVLGLALSGLICRFRVFWREVVRVGVFFKSIVVVFDAVDLVLVV